jgi:[protein-PII] uridylyltransferase
MADLYHNTAAALRGGRADESGVQAHLEARAESRREALVDELGDIPPTLLEMETAYWTGFDVPDLAWHATALKDGGDVVCYRFPPEGGALTLMVCGKDRPGLFADLAGTLANLGANVVSAQVFTNRSGRILDLFILQDSAKLPFGQKDASRLQRLEKALRDTLAGTGVKEPGASRMGRREAAFLVQPSAQIRNDVSTEYTVVDIAGRDRPGLLYDVASVLADSGLSIHSAHVGSYGERMFDAFYVQTATGGKLIDSARIETLKDRLLDALGQHEPDAPETPARKLKRSRAVDSF